MVIFVYVPSKNLACKGLRAPPFIHLGLKLEYSGIIASITQLPIPWLLASSMSLAAMVYTMRNKWDLVFTMAD